MKLCVEHKPILVVSLNTAWQKTLLFSHLTYGEVNRARLVRQCGGGKGVNVIRVYRNLGVPAAFAGFYGGSTGELLRAEIASGNTRDLSVQVATSTRCCTTVISEDDSRATELIEPSGVIAPEEARRLLDNVLSAIPECSAVLFVGSVPPGITEEFCAAVAACAEQHHVPFILDAVKGLPRTLACSCRLLKVNAEELCQIADTGSIAEAASSLLKAYPKLEAIGVTDGAQPASLFIRGNYWKLKVPRLEHIVSPIGGGDCTDAVMTWRIAQGAQASELPTVFGEALACATASCMTDTPSVFDAELAEILAEKVVIQKG